MEEKEKKCSFSEVIKDEGIFYGVVRWLILIIGVATLIILVFMPVMSYLEDPGEGTLSRLISMIINAMGVASLLLAIHSLSESRGSNKEIHEVTDKLEKFSHQQERDVVHTINVIQTVANQLGELAACQEKNINQTMDKLEELGRTQENIHTMLKNSSTAAGSRISLQLKDPAVWERDSSSIPGTADPEEDMGLAETQLSRNE